MTLCAALALFPLRAAAEPTILWQAPPECPNAAAGRAEVARLLGRPLSQVADRKSIAVRVAHEPARPFEATIRIANESAARTLSDADCNVLTHAVAVVVAFAIDSEAKAAAPSGKPRTSTRSGLSDHILEPGTASNAATASAPSAPGNASPSRSIAAGTGAALPESPSATAQHDSQSATATVTPASPPSAAPPTPVGAPAQRRPPLPDEPTAASEPATDASPTHDTGLPKTRAYPPSARGAADVQLYLGLGAACDFGPLPRTAAGVLASAGLLGDAWQLAVRLSYFPAQTGERLPEAGGAAARIALGTAAVEGGTRVRFSHLDLTLSGGLETGVFFARAVSSRSHALGTPAWFSAALGVGLRFQMFGPLVLGLYGSGQIALARPQFAVTTRDGASPRDLFRPASLGGRLFAVLEMRLL